MLYRKLGLNGKRWCEMKIFTSLLFVVVVDWIVEWLAGDGDGAAAGAATSVATATAIAATAAKMNTK